MEITSNVITIDDVSKKLNVSRNHIKMLVERDIIKTLKFENILYVTSKEYEKIKKMFEESRNELDDAFKNKEKIHKKAVEEIATLLNTI